MLINGPEMNAVLQSLQPTPAFLQLLEGYRDIESAVAVLETREGFEMEQNLAQFMQDAPLVWPEAKDRIRYLGFFLTGEMDTKREFHISLQFAPRFAGASLTLLLRGFGLQARSRGVQLTQGISLHQEARIATSGTLHFTFEPLSDLLKHPERLQGFLAYLLWPAQQDPESYAYEQDLERSQIDETEAGIIRARPGLNVYRKIDTRV